MAGTLVITTLSDGTNSTSSTNCIQGSAKAWACWNGTNGTIKASYNVSSTTRTGTGAYTISFTNALSDANFAVSGLNNSWVQAYTSTKSSSSFGFQVFNSITGNNVDVSDVSVAVFR
jgi:hypothetical protein